MKGSLEKGFTLLEVLIAITIMGIVFTSIFRMHSQTVSMTFTSRFYSVAPLLCQQKLSEILSGDLGSESEDSGDFGEDFPGYSWHSTVKKVTSEALEKEVKMIQVDVTVSLNENGLSHAIRSYRYDNSEE